MVAVTTHVSSLRQVDRIKATTVGKTYELTMTRSYVSKWGLPQAVRELIQNALDSDSPFKYEFRKTGQGTEGEFWVLILNSEFTILTPQTLLLGHTSKAGTESIGSFGEGYKLALLVLTRLGYDVDMFNGDVLWRPRFRYSRTYGEELLVVDESFLPDKTNKGLTVMVWGLSDQDRQAIVASCVRMQDNIGAIKQTKYGDILLEQPKKLYVGDLYICETELLFGYNIRPTHIQLERDRQTVDSWDLRELTGKMWLDTGEHRRIAEMISKDVQDVVQVGYNTPELVAEECYRIFREQYPTALIASSPAEVRKKIGDGLIKKVYIGGGSYGGDSGYGMFGAVSSSPTYRRDLQSYPSAPPRATPHEILRGFYDSYREKDMSDRAVKAFLDIMTSSYLWGYKDE